MTPDQAKAKAEEVIHTWRRAPALTAEDDFGHLVDAIASSLLDASPRWVYCADRMPEENGQYLTTILWAGSGPVRMLRDFVAPDFWTGIKQPIAWMPLPSPAAPPASA